MKLKGKHFGNSCIGRHEQSWQGLLECKQVPSVPSMTRWLSCGLLQKKSSPWSHKPTLSSPTPEGEPGLRDAVPFLQHCIWSFSICPAPSRPGLRPGLLPGAHGCYRERVSEQSNLKPLLPFPICPWVWGGERFLLN